MPEYLLSQIAVVQRRRKDLGDINALANSIRENGQISAGVVRRATEGDLEFGISPEETPYVLVAGGRRYAACVLAGIPTFRADDFGELPLLRQKVLELEENLNRKDLTWDEEVLLKEEIHAVRQAQAAEAGITWTQTNTAVELHESQANLNRDLQLAKALHANPELKNAPTKFSAVRMVAYDKKIAERTAAVSGNALSKVGDRLFTMDMRDFVRTLPNGHVDLCFTDFPFGIDYSFAPGDRNTYSDSQDSLYDLLADVVPEIIRVTKPTGWLALMMGSTNYAMLVELIETCCATHFDYADVWWEQTLGGDWKRMQKGRCNAGVKDIDSPCTYLTVEDPEWIWYRPNSRNPSMHPELHAQNQYEKIAVVNRGSAVMVNKSQGNMLVHDAVYEDRIHEMQRPHSLCVDVVERLTIGGERVLDLCFGSGSALAAAASLQRDFLGCDINPANLGPALMWITEHMPKEGV